MPGEPCRAFRYKSSQAPGFPLQSHNAHSMVSRLNHSLTSSFSVPRRASPFFPPAGWCSLFQGQRYFMCLAGCMFLTPSGFCKIFSPGRMKNFCQKHTHPLTHDLCSPCNKTHPARREKKKVSP